MADFVVKKGLDITLEGRPSDEIEERIDAPTAVAHPGEYRGVKQRLLVAEGDMVKRGTILLEDKKNARLKIRAPAGGRVDAIVRGDRRLIEQIVIRIDREEQAETFKSYSADELLSTDRKELMAHLQDTGYLVLIRQRPFSCTAHPSRKPKSIFVNAMNTAPFGVSADVVANDDPEAFQAGLNALTSVSGGDVHLCASPGTNGAIKAATGVKFHTFSGPHPAGNTSVHISRVAPMKPTDLVWTLTTEAVVLLGRLLLDGSLPATRIIALGGNGIKEKARKHYRVRVGGSLERLLSDSLESGEQRILDGNILSGRVVPGNDSLRLTQSGITAIPEGRERFLMGWLNPGVNLLSFMPAYISTWLGRTRRTWPLNTNRNGGHRAMVLTGHYDKVMPLDILVDYLVRAVLAGDADEAIKLGILETVPEDFALCDFVCPCKMEIQDIIRDGLEQIEEEGI